jgi:glucosamine--fructose-6-phosphate aminotransferase (isomerizing)
VASLFEQEIQEQPGALRRLLAEGEAEAEAIGQAVRRFAPRYLMLAARGSSDNAARYAQYLFGAENRLAVALAAPSLFTHYGAPPRLEGALVVGVSQSGQSPDVVEVVREGRRQGALTVAVSNDRNSPLAQAAEHNLWLRAGAEQAVAATKTYTTQLLGLAMLSVAVAAREDRRRGLGAVPEQVERTIALVRAAAPGAARLLAPHGRLAVLGRGYNLATAFEAALKVKETSYVSAEPYSTADFLHGPIATLDRTLPLVLVAASAPFAPEMRELAARARAVGAPLVAITDQADLAHGADASLDIAPGAPEWLTPFSAAAAAQVLALELCRARGLDPDAPRGLRKVTLTR